MSSEIPEIGSKSVYIDDSKSMNIENNFLIEDYIGFGGSSYVFKSKVLNKDDKLNFYPGMDIVIKLCKPILSMKGCRLFKDEAQYTNVFSSLNYKKLCYNYPVIYGFFHRCIFFSYEDLNKILEYINKSGINEGVDAFIIYSCCPKHIELSSDIIDYVLKKFDIELLIDARNTLPKTNNIYGLYLISKTSNENKESDEKEDWNNNKELYDYLDLGTDLKCDIFLLLQYLNGKNIMEITSKNPSFKFTDNMFFESFYSMLCSISILNVVQIDIQVTNAMIIETSIPRIYFYKDSYYLVTGDMFYWIDFSDLNFIDSLKKSSFNKYNVYFTKEQKELLNRIFDGRDNVSSEHILDSLFGWLSRRVGVMDKNEADRYMSINYNHRLVNVKITEFKI
jgi:hypothetical protein